MTTRRRAWFAIFLLSGTVSLAYQMVWMRTLGLMLGSSATAGAITVGAFMGGLALGGRLAPHLPGAPARTYARLELFAAGWAFAFPWLLDAAHHATASTPNARMAAAVLLLLPPTTALGATWPLIAGMHDRDEASGLYAINTFGAVVGVLGATFVAIPWLGVQGTAWLAALGGATAAALAAAQTTDPHAPQPPPEPPTPVPAPLVVAVALAGVASLGLEITWFRLCAVALGGTVQVHAIVLATFLATMALGAHLGRRVPADPASGLARWLGLMGVCTVAGAALWGQVPYAIATAYTLTGPDGVLPTTAMLAALIMGAAPLASGAAFSCAVRALPQVTAHSTGRLYAANTLGSIVGAWTAGLVVLPALGLHATTLLLAGLAGVAAAVAAASRRAWFLLAVAVPCLLAMPPTIDRALLAVGVHLRISDFADPSADALYAFAHDGWTLLSYEQGLTGAVAVGRSDRTGNVWLSVNGKVDASTGDDMPTQELSGVLPVAAASDPARVLVVGLASGVTAGAVLRDPRVQHMTVVELEPAVVRASHAFDHVNGRPLADPRTTLVVDDARAVLLRDGPRFDVIISEPSNPWISGVSNLFTEEYWRAARARLHPDGVMCQWVQLYGLGPDEFRALVRTFQHVFPNVYLFETIEGSDALLVGGHLTRLDHLPLAPTLGPDGVRRLGGRGWRNTDDRPRIEWEAPKWLHYATGRRNAEAIDAAR